ncbi:MAG: 3-deoxy-7-phosphoheptulonate synthase [Ruminococcaceae bacterium]|nr:3-deoxy-7-phosphoheptulonate synthase [Oscillospiraceae bacterium]
MNMDFDRKLAIPAEVKEMYPLSRPLADIVDRRRVAVKEIISGHSDKLLLVIGPCSADNEDSVIDYISRLRTVQEKVADKLFIVPRIYTNKPRTTGEGYKGMLHQPDPNGKPDLFKGIVAIREMHMRALAETGFSCADEMLYPENHKYLDDLLSYVAVGARSVEDQQHRLTASGLEVPAGMKNPTGGDIDIMMNAITAAQHSHTFVYRGWQAHSHGNPHAHAVLRGYVDKHGKSHPNYHYEDLIHLAEAYAQRDLQNPAVIVDTNHANSGKRYLEQIRIAKEVMMNRRYSDTVRSLVKGFMIESYIEDGAQPIGGGCYGKSITDPCLGWEKSERLIYDLAELM